MSNQQSMQVAETILAQLGGTGRLSMMVGAKNFVAHESAVSFKLGTGSTNGINYVKVTLDASDTYTVAFGRVRSFKLTDKGTHEGIYCDMLVALFEKETGFFLSF